MKKISLAILTLLVALTACKKVPEVNLKYVDVERDLITVGTTTATVQCDYQYIATLKKAYLYYGEGENEADMNTAEMRVVQSTLYVDLTGLKENTTYSYYYEFHNGFNSMRTVAKTFKTESGNGGGDEPPTPTEIMLPTVITAEVTEITTNSAQCGGEVVNDGGAEVTERGICWGTNENPTLNDSHLASGMGIGVYTALMNGLEANTTYHVRAYATNEAGTVYGLDKEFTTLSGGGGGNAPIGAIDGLFSVSPTKKVYFSQGNLQYQASTKTWKFAEHQWDFVGDFENGSVFENGIKCDNSLISSSYDGWVDLFGWGTSGYHDSNDPYNLYYQPWSSTSFANVNMDYNVYGYGPSSNMVSPDLTGESANYDWGIYNSISNGGNIANHWRTLTKPEWEYVFQQRETESGIRFAMAKVNNVNGVILLPDNWNENTYTLYNTDYNGNNSNDNVISASQWNTLQNAGAVFIPDAGKRGETWVDGVGTYGYYWSASALNSSSDAHLGVFVGGGIGMALSIERFMGVSVRLVKDANPQNKTK